MVDHENTVIVISFFIVSSNGGLFLSFIVAGLLGIDQYSAVSKEKSDFVTKVSDCCSF